MLDPGRFTRENFTTGLGRVRRDLICIESGLVTGFVLTTNPPPLILFASSVFIPRLYVSIKNRLRIISWFLTIDE